MKSVAIHTGKEISVPSVCHHTSIESSTHGRLKLLGVYRTRVCINKNKQQCGEIMHQIDTINN